GLFSNWVHSGFGWRLTHLQLGDELDVGRDTLPTRKDFVFDRLREFRDLEGLQLMGVTLSDEMVEGLVSLPRLQRLSLLNCRLPPEAVSRLGGLTPLKELELHHCRIADDDLQRIDNLTNLTTLRL